MSAIIHKFNKPLKKGSGQQHKLLVEQIANCLNQELSRLIGNMFDGADDILFQLAENASSNEDQTEYFDTMRMLRIERKNIGQNFAANLKQYLSPTSKQSSIDPELDFNELSLVDQDEMEEMVAVSAMHSKAMNLYGEAVNHLQARIEFMSLKTSKMFDKDALSPKNICESFKDALLDIELSTNNKLVLYKLFDQEVIIHLENLYHNLNQLFIDQGILPQITLGLSSPHKSPSKPPAGTSNEAVDAVYTDNPTYDPTQAPTYYSNQYNRQGFTGEPTTQAHNSQQSPAAGPANHNMQNAGSASHVINQFLQGELTATGPGIPTSFTTANNTPSSSGIQYYERSDVMHALSNLQQNIALANTPAEQINAEDFKRSLLLDLGASSGGAVTKQVDLVDEKTIDFIEMLFTAIVEDASISEAVTTLLLRLQIPVIKVAMLDSDFFVNSDHPCRTTLNLIAHLGRGLASREDELFSKLNRLVEGLLSDFDIDLASFERSTLQLEIIEQEELQATAIKERHTQKMVLQAHAREIVLSELQHHVKDKTLPKNAHKLILKHWSTHMFHQYIKYGKSSPNWRESVSIVVQLINLLQPIESSQGYFLLSSEKDKLLDVIHNTLLATQQNPVEIEKEVNNIFLIFEDMLKNNPYTIAEKSHSETYFISVADGAQSNEGEDKAECHDASHQMPEPEVHIEQDIIDPLQEQANIARDKIALLPSNIRPGVWFKVYTGEQTTARRVKLSVIIMEEAKLIFVDRIGVKVLEKDAEIFSEELNSELSLIIADHSAFDHALGMVINSLSNNN